MCNTLFSTVQLLEKKSKCGSFSFDDEEKHGRTKRFGGALRRLVGLAKGWKKKREKEEENMPAWHGEVEEE